MNQVSVGRKDILEVLLVTDDRDGTDRLVDSFEMAAANTTLQTVLTGETGLDALHRGDDTPALAPNIVLMDLPPGDALEFLEALESERRFAHIPVLVVVDDDTDDVTRYYERGVNACLERTDEVDELVSAVEAFWCNQVQLPTK